MKEKAIHTGKARERSPWANETILLFNHPQVPAQKWGNYFTQAQYRKIIKM